MLNVNNCKKYFMYHLRWQGSNIIFLPIMWALEEIFSSLSIRLTISAFVGACIFWYLDKWIFNQKKEE